jgi:hypothetical protein
VITRTPIASRSSRTRGSPRSRHLVLALLVLASGARADTGQPTQLTEYSELATAPEIARRMLSPLVAAQVARQAAQSGKQMLEQTVNLSDEKFVAYVPARRPPRGFALLVFVPPWQDARLPPGWAPVLDRYGVIFVSAARSGNAESVLDRREPLALLAAHGMAARYSIDGDSVFVAGFSGGARVAQRLALAFPDVFRGAILNAGSDPIGDPQMPLPPKDLFYRFQQFSRLVYVTGEADTTQLALDQASERAMRQWCVFNVREHVERGAGHEVAGPTAFAWSMSALLADAAAPPGRLAECRASIEQEFDRQLTAAGALFEHGQVDEAGKLLKKIDGRYGGLAAPRSVELQNKLSEHAR